MYYRIAIQRARDQLDGPSTWQWKSTVLSSLESVFQVLRLYGALPQEYLRVFSSPSREGLEEQFRHENSGCGSSSVKVPHFLQLHMIRSRGVTSAGGARVYGKTNSIAVSTRSRLDESARAAHAPRERSMSSLERRRTEQELGSGGDHDVPYSFVLPRSMPQVLAWMKLMGKVQRGELQP
jgi:hypothetical protein